MRSCKYLHLAQHQKAWVKRRTGRKNILFASSEEKSLIALLAEKKESQIKAPPPSSHTCTVTTWCLGASRLEMKAEVRGQPPDPLRDGEEHYTNTLLPCTKNHNDSIPWSFCLVCFGGFTSNLGEETNLEKRTKLRCASVSQAGRKRRTDQDWLHKRSIEQIWGIFLGQISVSNQTDFENCLSRKHGEILKGEVGWFQDKKCKQNLHLAVEWHTVLEWYRPTKRRKTVLLKTIGQPPSDR